MDVSSWFGKYFRSPQHKTWLEHHSYISILGRSRSSRLIAALYPKDVYFRASASGQAIFKMCGTVHSAAEGLRLQDFGFTRGPAEEAANRPRASSDASCPVANTQESSRDQAADLPGDQGVSQVEGSTIAWPKRGYCRATGRCPVAG